jgi:hypothetical protein
MNYIVQQQSPWVKLSPGDVSFQLQSDVAVTNRAAIEFTNTCPQNYAELMVLGINNGWIQAVAMVPRTDPTLMWDRLKTKEV